MPKKSKKLPTMTESLRQAIAESGLTNLALSRESGVPRPSIIRFARGDRTLRLDIADKLATYFGLVLFPANAPRNKEK